ncbi:MBL fold metallo-hydrolase [Pantoea rodasii]|uniref:MBL fold metallo-hydrolase n=1 Tax=Pantoea rodasii TaxID=1076549 RepID=A0A2M9W6Y1_9GAMM|nr:Vmh family MBL fold metallo-hydrolase [Pantoea rodasii]ORM65454.1 MBL fold metallo-hydrolase [Pantoea rodasii]PJZ03297.1 MBL fold metallo-hydrolase [Pantoea rodasii]
MKMKSLTLTLALAASPAFAAPLHLAVYNPQEQGVFPVSSTLISGPHEAILVDAQFSPKDGEKLVEMIKASGKKLTQIVITSGDPDFYFGLEPIVKAFPQVKIVAAPTVVEHIEATKAAKLEYWGPKMPGGAPTQLYVPQITHQTSFSVDGERVELRHAGDKSAYLWIPANKAVLGGTAIAAGIHVWTADTQTPASREQWRNVLTEIQRLNPKVVIPGHYIGARPSGDNAVTFTLNYLQSFEKALQQHKGSAAVIETMKTAYPNLPDESSLELSAKVNTGEMKW